MKNKEKENERGIKSGIANTEERYLLNIDAPLPYLENSGE